MTRKRPANRAPAAPARPTALPVVTVAAWMLGPGRDHQADWLDCADWLVYAAFCGAAVGQEQGLVTMLGSCLIETCALPGRKQLLAWRDIRRPARLLPPGHKLLSRHPDYVADLNERLAWLAGYLPLTSRLRCHYWYTLCSRWLQSEEAHGPLTASELLVQEPLLGEITSDTGQPAPVAAILACLERLRTEARARFGQEPAMPDAPHPGNPVAREADNQNGKEKAVDSTQNPPARPRLNITAAALDNSVLAVVAICAWFLADGQRRPAAGEVPPEDWLAFVSFCGAATGVETTGTRQHSCWFNHACNQAAKRNLVVWRGDMPERLTPAGAALLAQEPGYTADLAARLDWLAARLPVANPKRLLAWWRLCIRWYGEEARRGPLVAGGVLTGPPGGPISGLPAAQESAILACLERLRTEARRVFGPHLGRGPWPNQHPRLPFRA